MNYEGPPKGLERHWPLIRARDLARLRGVKVQGLIKFLKRLNEQCGGKLLTQFKTAPGSPWYVNVRVLDALGPNEKQRDEAIKDLKIRVGELETKQRKCDVRWMKSG